LKFVRAGRRVADRKNIRDKDDDWLGPPPPMHSSIEKRFIFPYGLSKFCNHQNVLTRGISVDEYI
jgi:hypothetical protein